MCSICICTRTTPSLEPVMMTLSGSHSLVWLKATHNTCWDRSRPPHASTPPNHTPLMDQTCSQLPPHVAMSPCKNTHKIIQCLFVIYFNTNFIKINITNFNIGKSGYLKEGFWPCTVLYKFCWRLNYFLFLFIHACYIFIPKFQWQLLVFYSVKT